MLTTEQQAILKLDLPWGACDLGDVGWGIYADPKEGIPALDGQRIVGPGGRKTDDLIAADLRQDEAEFIAAAANEKFERMGGYNAND